MIDDLQQVYVERYGDVDITPVDPAQFAAPLGYFVIGYLDGVPVACGGWRVNDELDGAAEIKRMYVVDSARGKGLSRLVLAHLEATAREAGLARMVLETGTRQPEAISLYTSSGYERIPNFGVYRDHPDSRCFGKSL
ncbi:GNAT family N-acetyltransferase [Lentzea sp. NBRC 102530]|uniref:GNAT family N-acetyltransferase n=1 Tax=Lentzea sp. NBRC 102530 TaxID=3032201 RepID=UPI00255337FC|nr:GNAT family N-acetyltransferase [Lentzea sp. NBRC 102530]